MVTNSSLHYQIIKHIIDYGYAPDNDKLAVLLNAAIDEVEEGLYKLADYHGVVLHPHAPKVWVIHPFALTATNFLVKSKRGEWWGNCAWCSLGVAALLNEDVSITTSYGAHGETVIIHIINGEVQEKDLVIHFPVPMKEAWNNVIYTCTTMLVFKNEEHIDNWCKQHNIPKGDVQAIDKVWKLSQKWYGNHLNPEWTKWTGDEAKQIFKDFDLTHPIWNLEATGKRF
jgi:Alkylmercury lyase